MYLNPSSFKKGALVDYNFTLLSKIKFSFNEIFRAYQTIYLALYKLKSLNLYKEGLFYFYLHFYEIYFLQDALKKLSPKEVFISNHYDRWAFAFFESEGDFVINIIQHGIEDDNSVYPKTVVKKKIKQ